MRGCASLRGCVAVWRVGAGAQERSVARQRRGSADKRCGGGSAPDEQLVGALSVRPATAALRKPRRTAAGCRSAAQHSARTGACKSGSAHKRRPKTAAPRSEPARALARKSASTAAPSRPRLSPRAARRAATMGSDPEAASAGAAAGPVDPAAYDLTGQARAAAVCAVLAALPRRQSR